MFRVLVVFGVISVAAVFSSQVASADATYHSPPIRLVALGSASGSGFVINAHANGPQVAAHENYVLRGADANTTYDVSLVLYPFDPTCTSSPATVPATTLTTNGAGNGHADHFFAPSDVPPELHNATHGIIWQLSLSGQVVYQSTCQAVTLD